MKLVSFIKFCRNQLQYLSLKIGIIQSTSISFSSNTFKRKKRKKKKVVQSVEVSNKVKFFRKNTTQLFLLIKSVDVQSDFELEM